MRIKSITIEGMHKIERKQTYTFNQLAYLFGKNGAGKSTVLEAIQLALLGYIPNMSKTNEGIFQHANGRVMSVELVLDADGRDVKVTRTLMNNGKSTSNTLVTDPEGFDVGAAFSDLELPIFNFDEFKSMTSNKLKDWFIQFLPNSDESVDWEKELRQAVDSLESVDKEEEITDHINKIKERAESGLDLVRAVNADLKDELSYEKGRLQRSQSTIQSLVHYDDVVENVSVEELQTRIANDNSLLQLWSAYNAQLSNVQRINAELETLKVTSDSFETDEEYISISSSIKEIEDKMNVSAELIASLNKKVSNITTERSDGSAKLAIAKRNAATSNVCPFTQKECDEANKHLDSAKKEVNDLEKKLASIETDLKSATEELYEARNENATNTALINEYNTKLRTIMNNYSRYFDLKSRLDDIGSAPSEESVDIIQMRVKQNQDMLVKVSANNAYNAMIDNETKLKFKIELKIELLKAWIKLTDANGLQTRMMNKPFLDLQSKLDQYVQVMFGEDVHSHFNLSEKANSFSFGIKRGESYIPFDLLSSGEKCLYTISLMMCIVKDSQSPLKVILIDDLLDHLDTENVDKLFNSLSKVDDIQFILAGVQTCNLPQSEDIVINIQ